MADNQQPSHADGSAAGFTYKLNPHIPPPGSTMINYGQNYTIYYDQRGNPWATLNSAASNLNMGHTNGLQSQYASPSLQENGLTHPPPTPPTIIGARHTNGLPATNGLPHSSPVPQVNVRLAHANGAVHANGFPYTSPIALPNVNVSQANGFSHPSSFAQTNVNPTQTNGYPYHLISTGVGRANGIPYANGFPSNPLIPQANAGVCYPTRVFGRPPMTPSEATFNTAQPPMMYYVPQPPPQQKFCSKPTSPADDRK